MILKRKRDQWFIYSKCWESVDIRIYFFFHVSVYNIRFWYKRYSVSFCLSSTLLCSILIVWKTCNVHVVRSIFRFRVQLICDDTKIILCEDESKVECQAFYGTAIDSIFKGIISSINETELRSTIESMLKMRLLESSSNRVAALENETRTMKWITDKYLWLFMEKKKKRQQWKYFLLNMLGMNANLWFYCRKHCANENSYFLFNRNHFIA